MGIRGGSVLVFWRPAFWIDAEAVLSAAAWPGLELVDWGTGLEAAGGLAWNRTDFLAQ